MGVVIPQDVIEQSKEKKRRHRTLRQMPIYRDASELKYRIMGLYLKLPRKMTKFVDTMLATSAEAKKCIGLAEGTRNPEARAEYFNYARIFTEDTFDDISLLKRLNLIGSDAEREMKKLAKSIVAQSVAMRDYAINDEGNHVG